MIRVGLGFDAHRFENGDCFVLGGVEIPYEKSLAGLVDADVLTHAICDAILGAAALGDIGRLYPESDPQVAEINSMELLREVVALVASHGMRLNNVDAVVVAERPKLAPFINKMRQTLAEAIKIPEGAVGVKATTSEKLGFTGREEGIAAHAICTVIQTSP